MLWSGLRWRANPEDVRHFELTDRIGHSSPDAHQGGSALRPACALARRVWKPDRRRDREVAQAHPACQRPSARSARANMAGETPLRGGRVKDKNYSTTLLR